MGPVDLSVNASVAVVALVVPKPGLSGLQIMPKNGGWDHYWIKSQCRRNPHELSWTMHSGEQLEKEKKRKMPRTLDFFKKKKRFWDLLKSKIYSQIKQDKAPKIQITKKTRKI